MGANIDKLARDRLLVIVFLLLVVCLIYAPGKPWISDSRWSIPTALSIIEEGNLNINEYKTLLDKYEYSDTRMVGEAVYSRFPIGTPLLATPFVLVFNQFTDIKAITSHDIPTGIEHFLASLFVAAAAAFVYLFSLKLVNKPAYAVVAALIFAFCTSAWSTAGLGLWQHGPSMLMLSIALYLIITARDKPSNVQYAALPLAYSYVIRPTDAIPLVLLTVFIAIHYRRYFLRYCCWGLLIALPFVIYNFKVYGSPLSPYYQSNTFSTGTILEGLAGNLVSPSRGLFVYSPVLIASFWGVYLKIRDRTLVSLDYFLIAIIFLHWLLISANMPWFGGHSYGPRLFTDMLPFLIYFLLPSLIWFGALPRKKRTAVAPVLLILVSVSVFAQFQGAFSGPARDWNVHPEIENNLGRLWDWSDVPFLKRDY